MNAPLRRASASIEKALRIYLVAIDGEFIRSDSNSEAFLTCDSMCVNEKKIDEHFEEVGYKDFHAEVSATKDVVG